MKAFPLGAVLRTNAVLDFALGALLLSGTWDGLYDTLDLPQAKPALLVQIGGALLAAFSYLLWLAPTMPEMAQHVARAAALANALAGAVIVIWLVFEDLAIGTLGTVELSVAAAVLGAFAAAQAGQARVSSRAQTDRAP